MYRELPVFAHLPEEAEPLLRHLIRKRLFAQHSFIFRQGDPLTHLYFVLSGEVKVYRSDAAGKEQVISFQQTGNLFPHIGIFRKGSYPGNAYTQVETETAVIAVEDFKRLIETYPSISYEIHEMMEEKVMDLQRRLGEMVLNNANERILLLLLRLADSHGTKGTDGWTVFSTRFTNAELANMIGTARETVNRCISGLRGRGLLQVNDSGAFSIRREQIEKELYLD